MSQNEKQRKSVFLLFQVVSKYHNLIKHQSNLKLYCFILLLLCFIDCLFSLVNVGCRVLHNPRPILTELVRFQHIKPSLKLTLRDHPSLRYQPRLARDALVSSAAPSCGACRCSRRGRPRGPGTWASRPSSGFAEQEHEDGRRLDPS